MKPFRVPLGPTCALLLTATVAQADPRLEALSDAPDLAFARPQRVEGPATYPQALLRWKSARDVSAWLGAHFRYDRARALALSETARAAGSPAAVLEPEAFFAEPTGVCVDVARFAVSVLRRIEPQSRASYLMIEFEPVEVAGRLLRRHWLATFQLDGKHHFFGDSKRPGHIAGPYDSVDAFIAEYGVYRGRAIVGHKILQGYERRIRTQSARPLSGERAPGAP